MEEAYRDPSFPASFGGVDGLFRAAKGKVKRNELKKWLQGVDAYTLHKPARKTFPTNRVIVYSISQQFQSDLVDVTSLRDQNDGFRYILTCIDILSKYAWAIPLKTKRGEEIVKAFQKIFSDRKPLSLQSDKGSEFLNVKFQKFLKEQNVRFFTTFNATKASVVERFNRTLKTKMWKYFTNNRTYRYIDVLDKLIDSYNHTYHSSIKITPAEVTKANESRVWFTLYGDLGNRKKESCAYNVGDTVRVSKHKLTFEKGYQTNWTEEIFTIMKCIQRFPPVYQIKDLLGEPIQGTFYKQELQKVQLKENFLVEKVLKKRTKKGKLEYYVKYKGYPDKFNQWIPNSHLFSI